MKVAIVHDDLIQFGGAENVFLAIAEMFPDAHIYTSVISPEWEKVLQDKKIKYFTSFMQRLPNKIKWNRFYSCLLLHTFAFESFNLKNYDVVISSSARYAHGVITKPETLHVCYMHSPGRMWWQQADYFSNEFTTQGFLKNLLMSFLQIPLSYLRVWDFAASSRVDKFIANSKIVKDRIKKYYGKDAEVIYPFCESFEEVQNTKGDYFLIISRLLPWKKIDVAVEAFTKLSQKLVIIGEGPDKKRLQEMASQNVKFLGYVSDEEKKKLLKNCEALIYTQNEDFGIVPLEAMSAGKPVIAFKEGGVLETVIEGKTGEFFNSQTSEALQTAVLNFDITRYNPVDCVVRAKEFSKEAFIRRIRELIEKLYVPIH